MPQERWPEELAALRDELDALFRRNPYLDHLGAEVLEWGLGWARTRLVPREADANIVGNVHGGVVVGLADAAFEIACNSYGRRCVAVELSTHFLAPAAIGEPLTAVAHEQSRSARLASYRIEVNSEGGALVATLLALAYRTDAWHPTAEPVPDDWKQHY